MGANWQNRNSIDARLMHEVQTGTGQILAWNDPTHGTEWNMLLGLRSTTNGGVGGTGAYVRPVNFDTDQDGMPDAWEVAHGLDPAVADNNGDFDNDGYTNLEEYLNELAEWPAPRPIIFSGATNSRYEQITNWDIARQPSKFDEAVIHNAQVPIDSVGQHARVLSIAPTAGDAVNTALSAGGIEIAEQLKVANSGQFVQSGGQLIVPAVQLSGSGLLKLTSGRDKVLDVNSLSITGSARLDVGDNHLIVRGGAVGTWHSGAYDGVSGLIASGRNGGAWNGSGIVTSSATSGNLTTLGVVRAGDVNITTFAGRSVGAGDVLVMYTYGGDANLDGKINVDDYGRIDFAVPLGVSGWSNGDFNYDGKINVDDYGIIDFNVAAQGAPFSTSAKVAAMPRVASLPEPATFSTLALLGIFLARRRRIL